MSCTISNQVVDIIATVKKKEGKCKMCAIPIIFSNFEKDIEKKYGWCKF